jgi:hypothetical protein
MQHGLYKIQKRHDDIQGRSRGDTNRSWMDRSTGEKIQGDLWEIQGDPIKRYKGIRARYRKIGGRYRDIWNKISTGDMERSMEIQRNLGDDARLGKKFYWGDFFGPKKFHCSVSRL